MLMVMMFLMTRFHSLFFENADTYLSTLGDIYDSRCWGLEALFVR
jgi:hypothetical protein